MVDSLHSQTSPSESGEISLSDSPSSDFAVSVRQLSKRYGEFEALADCSLDVKIGEVFGLLGPNGAGKTTLIRSLLGYLHPTSGRIAVCGHDPQVQPVAVRSSVSYLPGDARLPRHHRGDALLRFFSQLHPRGDLQRSLSVADRLELDLKTRVGMMSTGMRQKLALAVVFGPDTPMLILDEPTANLDPTVRATVLDLVREAHTDGRTVMFSSHVLSEIEETCHRVAFLRRGRLVHQLVMRDLFQKHRIHGEVSADRATESLRPPESLADSVRLTVTPGEDSGYQNACMDTSGDLAPVLSWISQLGLTRVRIEPLGLRSVYDQVHDDSLSGAGELGRIENVGSDLK